MAFFRLCQNCKKFFFDEETFHNHDCGLSEQDQALNERTKRMELDLDEDVDYDAESAPEFPKEAPTSNERQDGKRALKAKYVAFLKEKGIDMSNERSFKKVEDAYVKHGGKI